MEVVCATTAGRGREWETPGKMQGLPQKEGLFVAI